jgi:regulator of ribonuclease activity A
VTASGTDTVTGTDPSSTTGSAGQVTVGTADLADQFGDEVRSCDLQLAQYGGHAAFTGTIRTIACHQDNGLVKSVLNEPGEGNVLVVDGRGSLHTALMGDLIAAAAVRNGWVGVVINGPVRDVSTLRTLELGIKALGSNPRKSAKNSVGEVDVPVSFGGITFVPGETLTSDDDGIVVTGSS